MRIFLVLLSLFMPMGAIADPMTDDGPYIVIPAGAQVPTGVLNMDDVIALADLDGDPTVISAQEKEMIALLTSLLIAQPVQN